MTLQTSQFGTLKKPVVWGVGSVVLMVGGDSVLVLMHVPVSTINFIRMRISSDDEVFVDMGKLVLQ